MNYNEIYNSIKKQNTKISAEQMGLVPFDFVFMGIVF